MEDHNRSNYRQPASPGTEPSPGQAQAGSSGNSGPDTSVDAGTSDTSRRGSGGGAERRPRGWRQRVGRTMSMPVGPEQQAVPSAPFFSCTVQYQGRGQLRRCVRVYTPARSPSPCVGQLFLVEFALRPQRRQASGSQPYPSSQTFEHRKTRHQILRIRCYVHSIFEVLAGHVIPLRQNGHPAAFVRYIIMYSPSRYFA